MKLVRAEDLKDGMRLALPFGRTATVSDVKVGRRFVNFRTEHGKTRISIGEEAMVEDD